MRFSPSAPAPAKARHRLSDTPTGVPVFIASADTLKIAHRLVLLGLIDGTEVVVESRGRSGEIILVSTDGRFLISARHAEHIWVGYPPAQA
jgi:Fe2+ transport system protein FeoA